MVIDNDRIGRNSVRTHLADSCDFEAIGEGTTAAQANAGIKLRQPNVIFADFGLLQEAGSPDLPARIKDRSILGASRTFSDGLRTAIALQGPRRQAALRLLSRLSDNGGSHALYG